MGAFLGSQSLPGPVLLRDLLHHVSEREAKVMSLACLQLKRRVSQMSRRISGFQFLQDLQ